MLSEKETAIKLQKEQLKILKELDRVCAELNIQYCAAYGTAIGVLRHHGFIPWDDDIDVHMMIDDLEKLQKNSDLFKSPFFLQYHESDPQYGLMITRLRNSQTTLIEKTETDRDINHGIFIDIYPLYNTSLSGKEHRKQMLNSMLYRLMLYGKTPENHGAIMKIGSRIILNILPEKAREKLKRRTYTNVRNHPYTGYISTFYGGKEAGLIYEKDWLFPAKEYPFEDCCILAGPRTDSYLRLVYGDYMKLPPIEKRTFHHDYACIDFDKAYTEYKRKIYCKESSV